MEIYVHFFPVLSDVNAKHGHISSRDHKDKEMGSPQK
jgi:hypothetical protein